MAQGHDRSIVSFPLACGVLSALVKSSHSTVRSPWFNMKMVSLLARILKEDFAFHVEE